MQPHNRRLSLSKATAVAVILFPASFHNDVDVPFPKTGEAPAYLSQLKAVMQRHPGTTISWAQLCRL